MENRRYIHDFLDYLDGVKNYSKHTLVNYKNDLTQFALYLNESGLPSITDASHIHVRSWIVKLYEEEITPKSINRKISSLRSFYAYLKRNELVKKSPMLKITGPKIPKKLPRYVDNAKINEILDDRNITTETYQTQREYIIISILYHTGMRRAELLSLEVADVNIKEGYVKVLGKGNKERIIPLEDQIIKEIQTYLEFRASEFPTATSKSLILTDKGKAAYPKLIYNIVSKVLKRYNASEKSSPHVLRHTFATHLTANGAELNAVKELLGHASLAATQVYTHNSIERLKQVYDKAHPKSKS